jgi:hypothetical protein
MTDLTTWKSSPVCLEIFGDGGVEIGQIVRVEDDALAVDLGIAHPERVKEPELFA